MSKKTVTPQPRSAASDKISFNRRFLYLISFIEGGSVMAIELAGAWRIAPFCFRSFKRIRFTE